MALGISYTNEKGDGLRCASLGAVLASSAALRAAFSQRMGERQGDRLECVQGLLVDNGEGGNHRDDSPAYSGISSR